MSLIDDKSIELSALVETSNDPAEFGGAEHFGSYWLLCLNLAEVRLDMMLTIEQTGRRFPGLQICEDLEPGMSRY